jgi:hypothetical protein
LSQITFCGLKFSGKLPITPHFLTRELAPQAPQLMVRGDDRRQAGVIPDRGIAACRAAAATGAQLAHIFTE